MEKILNTIRAMAHTQPNNQEFGANVRVIVNKIPLIEEIIKHVNAEKGAMEVTYDMYPFSIRFEYWQQAPSEIEQYLFSKGMELKVHDDEDCGQLISYSL